MASDEKKKTPRTPATEQDDAPAGFWARHGNKVLIALTAALLIFWAVRYRQRQEVERQNTTRDNLASAWVALGQFRLFAEQPRSDEADRQLSLAETQINQAVQAVVDDEKIDPRQAAWAWLARGEVYWTLAHRPQPSATTAPTSAPASQPATDPLGLARNAYEQVINKFPSDPTALTVARFGLAAVAEEKGDFAVAREQYKKLIETPNFTDVKSENPAAQARGSTAEERLKRLNDLDKPLLLLPATQPVAAAPSLPANLPFGGIGPMPTLLPSASVPTTRPAATQP